MIQVFKSYLMTTIAAVGAAYCLVSLGEGHPLCATSGCEIYANYKLLGFSLYGWGLVAFALLAILAGPGCKPHVKQPLYGALCLALTLDSALLAYQALFWTCLSCLLIAALIGLIALAGYWNHPYCRTRLYRALAATWFILFSVVSLLVAKEVVSTPWILAGSEEAEARIYFSPTCQACQSVTLDLLDGPDVDKVAFIPVAKSPEDARRIAVVVALGPKGPEAVRRLFQEDLPGAGKGMWWELLRNKMAMASQGITRVPTIVSPFVLETGHRLSGLPFALLDLPPMVDTQTDAGCSVVVEEPCADKKTP